jgi:hypothetical protein
MHCVDTSVAWARPRDRLAPPGAVRRAIALATGRNSWDRRVLARPRQASCGPGSDVLSPKQSPIRASAEGRSDRLREMCSAPGWSKCADGYNEIRAA